jgi:DNA-binding NarL/FixJ family response regulator
MLDALNLILSGGIYIPPEILNLSDADRGLTEQQIDVLTLMMQGKSSKEISRALDLAETTVKKHIAAILRILRGFEK